jgi:serine/threonine protein kinase
MEKEIQIFTSTGKHRYLPELLATCTEEESGDKCMIMEFAPLGSLDQVLSKAGEDGVDVTSLVSITIAAQVAEGTGHLHLHDIIHRDLAARNILVFSFDPHDWKRAHVKVTDYGLALLVSKVCAAAKTMPEITTNGRSAAGPTRWMAPESLGRRLYSEKSDVWAFGVLLYEIMTLAMLPYFDIGDDREVARAVLAGEHLPKPERASDSMYAIMQSCWRRAAKERPRMPDVQARLQETFASAMQEEQSKGECVVCLERVSTHALMPCGHRCVCERCAPILNNRACPICRTLVEKAVRIFG